MKPILRIALIIFVLTGTFYTANAAGQLFFFGDPLIGKKAPEFTLKTVGGEETTLTKYREGKNAFVFFWATWCPYCRAQLQTLNERKDEVDKEGIKVILVDIQETADDVEAYIKKYKVKYDSLLDQEGSVSEKYGVTGLPTFYLVTKDGIVKSVEHAVPEDLAAAFQSK